MTTEREYVSERQHAELTPGASLRIARELQGLTQSELARLSGIPQPAISAFESGQEDMGIKRIKALAVALKVHPAVIAFPNWEAEVINLHARRAPARREPAQLIAPFATAGIRGKAKTRRRRRKG